jgi:tetratricopeptide (TPR) repeat protein
VKKTKNVQYYIAGSISLITFLAYLVTLRNEFVEWDDSEYIFENPFLKSPAFGFVKWAFSTIRTGNWHPLTWISYSLDYAIWGLNPRGYHLSNIILHAINAFLVTVLAMRLLETWKETAKKAGSAGFLTGRMIAITGGATGLLFGLHPVHVESVAWASERKDILCALFYLLGIMKYLRYAGGVRNEAAQINPYRNKDYVLALVFFVLALLSKPMAVTLPVVLLILDWSPLERIRSFKTAQGVLMEKLPFVSMSLICSIFTMWAQKTVGAMVSMELAPWTTRVLVAAKSLIAYLGKMIWPLNLLPFYPFPKDASFLSAEYFSTIALVVGITAICGVMARKRKFYMASWSFYAVTLAPVLGIIQVGNQAMADRYTYLPSLGPFFMIGLAAAAVWERINTSGRRRLAAVARIAVVCVGVFVSVSLLYLTVKQIGIWKNGVVLWTYAIEKNPGVTYLYTNRAFSYKRTGQLDKAMEDYDRAVAADPGNYEAYNNRAILHEKFGQADKAIDDLNRAISLRPSSWRTYLNLGIIFRKTGSLEKAMENFNTAIALNPDYPDSYFNRGVTYTLLGLYDRAWQDFNRVLLLDQDNAPAYYQRGTLYMNAGNAGLARSDYQKACSLGFVNGCQALQMF